MTYIYNINDNFFKKLKTKIKDMYLLPLIHFQLTFRTINTRKSQSTHAFISWWASVTKSVIVTKFTGTRSLACKRQMRLTKHKKGISLIFDLKNVQKKSLIYFLGFLHVPNRSLLKSSAFNINVLLLLHTCQFIYKLDEVTTFVLKVCITTN